MSGRMAGNQRVTIREKKKTALAEAGILDLDLKEGQSVVVVGNVQWPDCDFSLINNVVFPILRHWQPQVVCLNGGILHPYAVQLLTPESLEVEHRMGIFHHPFAAAVEEALQEKIWENAVKLLFQRCGEFVASWGKPGNSHVFYLPSVWSTLPNDYEALDTVYSTNGRVYKYREANEGDAPDRRKIRRLFDVKPGQPPSPSNDFKYLLGIRNKKVRVLRFGSMVKVNGATAIFGGDFDRRYPGGASNVDMITHGLNIVRTCGAKMFNSFETRAGGTLANARRHLFRSEVPALYDRARLAYKRLDYHLQCQGIWVGTVVRGVLRGQSYPVMRGADGCRQIIVDGITFKEPEPAGLGYRETIVL